MLDPGAGRCLPADAELPRGGSSRALIYDGGSVRLDGRAVGALEPNSTVGRGGSSVGNRRLGGYDPLRGIAIGAMAG